MEKDTTLLRKEKSSENAAKLADFLGIVVSFKPK